MSFEDYMLRAISLAEAPNRFLAGICEVELKSYYSDKTNWHIDDCKG